MVLNLYLHSYLEYISIQLGNIIFISYLHLSELPYRWLLLQNYKT